MIQYESLYLLRHVVAIICIYCLLLKIMLPFWARLIVAPPARGRWKVTLSVFLNSGGSCWFLVQEIYVKSNGLLSNNTYVFEPTFSDIYFTGWFNFSAIFSSFSGLTAFISGICHFFLLFLFFYLILHGQMHIRGLNSYFCGLMIGLGKKLVHVVPSGSPDRLWK